MRVDFYQHVLGDEEVEELRQTIASRFLAYGPRTIEFEKQFSRYLDVPHTVATNSCTNALFLCQKALGIGPGDEVITTPYTFVATPNTIQYTGATHVFADVEPLAGTLDPAAVEAAITPRTKAIVVVHLYGHMADMDALNAIAERHNLFLIEDAAHCVEGTYRGIRPGQTSTAAAFSFYATKNLAAGEGGALVTRDKALADRVRLIGYHGVDIVGIDRDQNRFKAWDITALGYKGSMFELQAAVLLPQLRRIEATHERRDQAYKRYVEMFREKCPYIALPQAPKGVQRAHHLFPIWCPGDSREALIQHLVESNVGIGIHYKPIHLSMHYAQTFGYRPGMFPVAEDLGKRCLSLPFFPAITAEQQAYVVERIAAHYSTADGASYVTARGAA